MMKIGFIGTGNMGGAILRGYAPVNKEDVLLAYRRSRRELEEICRQTLATPCDSIESLVAQSDMIFLGVKPQQFGEVLPVISRAFTPDKVLISMAAGVTIKTMAGYLGEEMGIVRIMPNLPIQIGAAMTGVARNEKVAPARFEKTMDILSAMGRAEEVEEDLINCVGSVSGSSPAFTFMYIDALMKAACARGMAPDKARVFAAQAVLGAAQMILEGTEDPATLTKNVCSPGGTTIEGVTLLQEKDFEGIVQGAFEAAYQKTLVMAKVAEQEGK